MTQEQYEQSQYYSKELGDRNFMATNEALKHLNAKYGELMELHRKLEYTYTMQQQEMQNMKQTINVMLAKTMGTGATQ